jgi:hypothetical protein
MVEEKPQFAQSKDNSSRGNPTAPENPENPTRDISLIPEGFDSLAQTRFCSNLGMGISL